MKETSSATRVCVAAVHHTASFNLPLSFAHEHVPMRITGTTECGQMQHFSMTKLRLCYMNTACLESTVSHGVLKRKRDPFSNVWPIEKNIAQTCIDSSWLFSNKHVQPHSRVSKTKIESWEHPKTQSRECHFRKKVTKVKNKKLKASK